MGTKQKKWTKAATVRAVKTTEQTAVAMIPVGVAIAGVGWAAVVSLLTSVADIPRWRAAPS